MRNRSDLGIRSIASLRFSRSPHSRQQTVTQFTYHLRAHVHSILVVWCSCTSRTGDRLPRCDAHDREPAMTSLLKGIEEVLMLELGEKLGSDLNQHACCDATS